MNKWQETIGHTLSMEDFFLKFRDDKRTFFNSLGTKRENFKV